MFSCLLTQGESIVAHRWPTALGAGLLAVAVVLLGIGIFTVFGMVKDPSAHLTDLKQQLTVNTTGPNASFSWSSRGYNATFTDTSTDNSSAITSWVWDFGDGTGYTGATPPTHTYSVTCPMCTEEVTLVVGDAAGHQTTATASVVVQKLGSSSGVGQSPSSQVKEPKPLAVVTEIVTAIELLLVMFLIGGSVAAAGWHLLRRETEAVPVPIRPRTAWE